MKIKLITACICLFAVFQGCKKHEVNITKEHVANSSSKGAGQTLATPPINTWVSIRNRNSGKAFQLPGFRTTNSDRIIQWTDGPGANGRFKITSVGANIYRITPSMSYGLSQCVEVASASTANGAAIVQYTYTGGTHQQWRFVDLGGGFFNIVNVRSGKLIEVPNASTANSVGLTQFTSNGHATQQWSFTNRGATTVNVACYSCAPWETWYIAGAWVMMHNGDAVTVRNDGGTSRYTARYETEYWVGSGPIVRPTVQVLSGSQTRTGSTGTSASGTCTGTPFPQEETFSLNGTVKWTDTENGCSYNVALRSE